MQNETYDDFEMQQISSKVGDNHVNSSSLTLTLGHVPYLIRNPTDPNDSEDKDQINGNVLVRRHIEVTGHTDAPSARDFTVDEYIYHLHAKRRLLKGSFFLGKILMVSYLFFLLCVFDQKRIFWYSKLSITSMGFWVAIESIMKLNNRRMNPNSVDDNRKVTILYSLRSILFLILSSYLTLYFAWFYDIDKNKSLLLVPPSSISFIIILLLVYSAKSRVDTINNIILVIHLLTANLLLVQYYTKLVGISSTPWDSICWPLGIGFFFMVIWLNNFFKLIRMTISYFGDSKILPHVIVQLYIHGILLFYSVYCLSGALVNFMHVNHEATLIKFVVTTGAVMGINTILLYSPAIRNLKLEIGRIEKFREEKCKIKVSIPYFMVILLEKER